MKHREFITAVARREGGHENQDIAEVEELVSLIFRMLATASGGGVNPAGIIENAKPGIFDDLSVCPGLEQRGEQ